jgi:hypothetical protein
LSYRFRPEIDAAGPRAWQSLNLLPELHQALSVAQHGFAANGMQKWGWTPTSAPVVHDRLCLVSQ